MKYISLFSGIEAASVAFHPLGWTALAFAEIEPFPSAVLAHHYPDVPNVGDVTAHDWSQYRGRCDLVVGGPPCQAFSVAGLRKSLDDDRGNLSLAYVRAVDAIDPEWCLTENVPGWLSTDDNAFGCFLGAMVGADAPLVPSRECGGRWTDAGVVAGPRRTAAWRTIDAQFCRVDGFPRAVPQRRRRVFVLAVRHPGGWRSPAALLPVGESLSGHPAPRREAGKGTAAQLARSVAIRGRDGTPQAELGDDVANAILTPNGGRGGIGVGAALVAPTLQANVGGNGNAGVGSEAVVAVAGTLNSSIGRGTGAAHETDFLVSPTLPARSTAGGGLGTDFDCDGGLVAGTLAASGAGSARPAGQNNELDMIVPEIVSQAMSSKWAKGSSGPAGDEVCNLVAHALRADGFDASEDGTGRGTPLVTAFYQDQAGAVRVTEPAQALSRNAGDIADQQTYLAVAFNWQNGGGYGEAHDGLAISEEHCPPLARSQTTAVAFSCKDHGADAGEVAPTLRGMGHDESHANGGGQVAVAFTGENNADAGLRIQTQSAHTVRGGSGVSMAVRRLTPRLRECCRLQGFPDTYLDITYRGKPAADGPRYKALGNSMAVNCMRWIGMRIQLVEDTAAFNRRTASP